jgi:hypothetical protein
VDELLAAILQVPPRRDAVSRWRWRLQEMYREALLSRLGQAELERAAARVATGVVDPYTVIEEWLAGHPNKEISS